jgi:hypothetical protein
MTETLEQPLVNLREALRAASRSAIKANAPSALRLSLTRSAELLELVLTTAAQGPLAALRVFGDAHAALSGATEALVKWYAWIEAGRPEEAEAT